jgi:uncharacterized damage-inducible protein DinB
LFVITGKGKAMSGSSNVLAASALQILREQHAMMREVLEGLSVEALNWQPGPETNSIAQMLAHTLESERFLISAASNIEVNRDREGPFKTVADTPKQILNLIDETERQLERMLGDLSDEALSRDVTRTTSVGQRTRPGSGWLIQAVAHAREHLGQASLTRQVYAMEHPE